MADDDLRARWERAVVEVEEEAAMLKVGHQHEELLRYRLAVRDIRHALAEHLGISINATPEETVARVVQLAQELAELRALAGEDE
jgi:hypothetical protein